MSSEHIQVFARVHNQAVEEPSTSSGKLSKPRLSNFVSNYVGNSQQSHCINVVDELSLTIARHSDSGSSSSMRNSLKAFNFKHVFTDDSSHDEIYYNVAHLVKAAVLGRNAAIVAFGVAGSGKSYTMEGTASESGVVQKAIRDVFKQVESVTKAQNYDQLFYIEMSFIEIANNTITSLLKPMTGADNNADNTDAKSTNSGNRSRSNSVDSTDGRRSPSAAFKHIPRPADDRIDIRESSNFGVFLSTANVSNKSSASSSQVPIRMQVSSADEALQLYVRAKQSRQTSKRGKSDQLPARGHLILTLHLESRQFSTGELVLSKLLLVDLAGSDTTQQTVGSKSEGARTSSRDGSAAKVKSYSQTLNINTSLTALGDVLSSLAKNSSQYSQLDSPGQHRSASSAPNASNTMKYLVPYKHAKLTHCLKEVLGGNCHTAMIAHVRVENSYYQLSATVLQYATWAATVRNTPSAIRFKLNATDMRREVEPDSERLQISILKRSTDFILIQQQWQRQNTAISENNSMNRNDGKDDANCTNDSNMVHALEATFNDVDVTNDSEVSGLDDFASAHDYIKPRDDAPLDDDGPIPAVITSTSRSLSTSTNASSKIKFSSQQHTLTLSDLGDNATATRNEVVYTDVPLTYSTTADTDYTLSPHIHEFFADDSFDHVDSNSGSRNNSRGNSKSNSASNSPNKPQNGQVNYISDSDANANEDSGSGDDDADPDENKAEYTECSGHFSPSNNQATTNNNHNRDHSANNTSNHSFSNQQYSDSESDGYTAKSALKRQLKSTETKLSEALSKLADASKVKESATRENMYLNVQLKKSARELKNVKNLHESVTHQNLHQTVQYERLQQEHRELKRQKAALEDENVDLRVQLAKAPIESAELRADSARNSSENTRLSMQYAEALQKLQSLQKESSTYHELKKAYDTLLTEKNELTIANAQLVEELGDLSVTKQASEKEVKYLNAQLSRQTPIKDSLQAQNQRLKERLVVVEEDVESFSAQVRERDDQISRLQDELDHTKQQQTQFQQLQSSPSNDSQQNEDMNTELIRTYQQRIDELTRDLQIAQDEATKLNEELEEADNVMLSMENTLHLLSTEREAAINDKSVLEDELAASKAEILTLRATQQTNASTNTAVAKKTTSEEEFQDLRFVNEQLLDTIRHMQEKMKRSGISNSDSNSNSTVAATDSKPERITADSFQQIKQLQQQVVQLSTELADAKTAKEQATQDSANLKKRNTKLLKDVQDITTKHEELSSKHEQLSAQYQQLCTTNYDLSSKYEQLNSSSTSTNNDTQVLALTEKVAELTKQLEQKVSSKSSNFRFSSPNPRTSTNGMPTSASKLPTSTFRSSSASKSRPSLIPKSATSANSSPEKRRETVASASTPFQLDSAAELKLELAQARRDLEDLSAVTESTVQDNRLLQQQLQQRTKLMEQLQQQLRLQPVIASSDHSKPNEQTQQQLQQRDQQIVQLQQELHQLPQQHETLKHDMDAVQQHLTDETLNLNSKTNRLQTEKTELATTIDRLKATIQDLNENPEMQKLKVDLERSQAIRTEITRKYDEERSNWQQQSSQQQQRILSLEEQLQQYTAKEVTLSNQLADLKKERHMAAKEHKQLQQQVIELQQQVQHQANEFHRESISFRKINEITSQLELKQQELEQAQDKIFTLKKKIISIKQELNFYQENHMNIATELQDLSVVAELRRHEVEDLTSKIGEFQQLFDSSAIEFESKLLEIKDLTHAHTELLRQQELANQMLEDLQNECELNSQMIDELHVERETRSQLLRSLELERDDLKSQLEAGPRHENKSREIISSLVQKLSVRVNDLVTLLAAKNDEFSGGGGMVVGTGLAMSVRTPSKYNSLVSNSSSSNLREDQQVEHVSASDNTTMLSSKSSRVVSTSTSMQVTSRSSHERQSVDANDSNSVAQTIRAVYSQMMVLQAIVHQIAKTLSSLH